ncbi:MAG: very short patch repair endonuclease [Nanoarchaeota archaeon]|nr:very short patch repair endonuclease [Nanoarchaeota archaeon]
MDIIEKFKKNWDVKEGKYLIDNYNKKTNKEIGKILNRTTSAIANKLHSFKLYKDREFICKIRKKRKDLNIDKELLNKLYYGEKKSIRKIAQEFSVGKTTIEHYFKKYNIKRRNHSEANIERFRWDTPWLKNAPKYIFKKGAEKSAKRWIRKKKNKIKEFEKKNKISFKKFLEVSYLYKKMNLSELGKTIGFGRITVSKLLEEYDIQKRSRFEMMALIKKEDRYQYGKTWEDLFGKKKALIRKKKTSLRSRKLIIKRLQNNEMPFSNTKIELMIKKELKSRNIYFKFQQPLYNLFVCDFVLPQYKIVLECDGDYWHANPDIYNTKKLDKIQQDHLRRDKFKNKYLEERGWFVLRFFESEIKNNTSRCINKVFNVIHNHEENKLQNLKNQDLESNEIRGICV